jgi:site-specific DNA recombinase
MKDYFAYIRVSTPKQGKGVSLNEQQSAIRAYAARHKINIAEWFEEKETAAKSGRAVFSRMLARLERGDAQGLIVHKIDRSARNLSDWASLSRLFDRGIDVQFAHDGVDLNSRGGRLSADIMAIVAADYIRNLREEVRKGFYGRLKQGLYPLPAPIGYLDRGKGEPKAVDNERAPLVAWAFERYASGQVGLKILRRELEDRGLRTQKGKPLSLSALSVVLNNPFYAGLIRIRKTNEMFEGRHDPIVSKMVFDRVQTILRGKTFARPLKHNLVFRKLVTCRACGYHLIGEVQKGHAYYRCHSESCKGTSLREEAIDDAVAKNLKLLVGDRRELGEIRDMVAEDQMAAARDLETLRTTIQLRIARTAERLDGLADALIDRLIDKELFERKKRTLLSEKRTIQDELATLSEGSLPAHKALAHLELGNIAYSGYRSANSDERRRILAQVTSNLVAHGKEPTITLKSPFREIAEWRKSQNGAPRRGTPRRRARKLLDIILAVDQKEKSTVVNQKKAA